jgi:hypothetical protein
VSRRPRPRHARAAWALVLAVTVVGCDAFRPETPNPPIAPLCDAEVALEYGDPDGVLLTLAQAIEAKDCGNGLQAYVGAFADSATDGYPFYATFAPELIAARIQAGQTIPVWNLDAERGFYEDFARLYDQDYLVEFTTTDVTDVFPTPGEAILHRRYQVTALEDGEEQGSVAVGYVRLTLRAVSDTRWAIVEWADEIDPEVGVDPVDPGQRSIGEWRLETR